MCSTVNQRVIFNLFHVIYDSDSDDEDLEQWEVVKHIDSYDRSSIVVQVYSDLCVKCVCV